MKIVVAGGRNKADFLIGSLLEKQHEVIVINDKESYCAYLSEKYNIPIITGNPCKRYILEEADIEDADILIALRPCDADNLTICQYAKKSFHVKKCCGNRCQSEKCKGISITWCQYHDIRYLYDIENHRTSEYD